MEINEATNDTVLKEKPTIAMTLDVETTMSRTIGNREIVEATEDPVPKEKTVIAMALDAETTIPTTQEIDTNDYGTSPLQDRPTNGQSIRQGNRRSRKIIKEWKTERPTST